MIIQYNSDNKITQCPKCKEVLWHWVDENRIKILGRNGQTYETTFIHINLICKCREEVSARSNLADQFMDFLKIMSRGMSDFIDVEEEENPYSLLSKTEKDNVSKNLSEKQKQIFEILCNEKSGKIEFFKYNQKEQENIIKEIAKDIRVPEKKHIEFIRDEVKKIKPDFHQRITTYKMITRTAD